VAWTNAVLAMVRAAVQRVEGTLVLQETSHSPDDIEDARGAWSVWLAIACWRHALLGQS
jgi:hypothetical protein